MSNNTGILNALAIAETEMGVTIFDVNTRAKVVLAYRDGKNEQYVVWRFTVDCNGAAFFLGYYYQDEDAAHAAYKDRVKRELNN